MFSSFIWRFMERIGAQSVTLIVSIILARLLEPRIYGTVALIMVFIRLLQVFVDGGLGMALVQKKNADNLDFSSVFWVNVLICSTIYFLMYMVAPFIADFYDRSELIPIIRVISLILIISGIKNIQQSYIARNLLFKKFFIATLGGTISAAIIGVFMAYNGFGIWALVAQYLSNALIDTVIVWFTVQWRPNFIFSFERFKYLFSYGWKLSISSFIDTIYNELRTLIIGKFYSEENLAYYTKGMQFPQFAISSITTSMNSVLLPILAQKQDNIVAIKAATKKVIRLSSLIIWPSIIGLIFVAKNFVVVILTEKWLPAVPFLQILCLGYAIEPLHITNLNVIKALGRSDLYLKMEIIKKTIALSMVIISSFFGVKVIAIGSVFYVFIASFINAFPNKRLIDYSYKEQLEDVSPFILMSLIMGFFVYIVGVLISFTLSKYLALYIRLIIQIVSGVIVYVVLCKSFKIPELDYCINTVRRTAKRKVKR